MIWWARHDRNGIFLGMEKISMCQEVEGIVRWRLEQVIMEWIEDLLSPSCVERIHAHGKKSGRDQGEGVEVM